MSEKNTQPTKLYAALAAAQEKCSSVAKDARNEFHRYAYASAEAIVGEAKRALAGTGLALVPRSSSVSEKVVTVETPEEIDRRTGEVVRPAGKREAREFMLVRRFELVHASGEVLDLEIPWPVIPEKGRPFDKAVASAATTSLAYLLRDLLLMPRVDETDNMDHGRREAPPERHEEAPQRPQAPPRARARNRTVMAEQLASERHAAQEPAAPPSTPVECKADGPTPAPTRQVLEEKIGALIRRMDEIEGLEPVTAKALEGITKANGDSEKLTKLLGWCERQVGKAETERATNG